jgi:Ca-activated chloride channel family protein
MKRNGTWWAPAALVAAACCLYGLAPDGPLPPARGAQAAGAAEVELDFIYGSEKKKWLEDVTKVFNAAGHKTPGGLTIKVNLAAMGSGECVEEIIDPKKPIRKAHLASPASMVYVVLGNSRSAKAGHGPLFVPAGGPGESLKKLVRSPVVIAMWEPMARAMGHPKKALGWEDVHALVTSDNGWGKYNRPQWGQFRFGHTHPLFSNSGMIAVLAEVYAAAKKNDELTAQDVDDSAGYIEKLERGIVHYGESTGFFGARMLANDMQYLNAAVLYESVVVENNIVLAKDKTRPSIVAIYPKEGTFWSDHPVGVVNRPWVQDKHREAARVYIDYLMVDAQQAKAVRYGFRPGLERVKIGAPLDLAHGVDPENQPKREMQVPPGELLERVTQVWKKNKKRSRIALVIDISGSMRDNEKLRNAKKGAKAYVDLLSDRESLSLMVFNDKVRWVSKKPLDMNAAGKKVIKDHIDDLVASGKTVLYDAIQEAYAHFDSNPEPDKISAVLVLTDGEDTDSTLNREQLRKRIRFDAEKRPTRIFTICYGSDVQKPTDEEKRLRGILKQISDDTKAKAYLGDPKNIRKVFVDIFTFN